jgi:hypothetical membrane protein
MRPTGHQLRSLGGVAGPVAFVSAWSILGATKAGYSPVHDPISRLAAVDSASRVAMTGGFLAFSLGVGLYARELKASMPGGAAVAALTTAVATVGIAVTPVGSPLGGVGHATCAGMAYSGLAALPIVGGRYLARQGRQRASTSSIAVGVASGACLLASVLSPDGVGLLQRTGLTLGDIWIVITAVGMARQAASPGGDADSRRRLAAADR